jgi:flagellar basal-body rod protein FlgB
MGIGIDKALGIHEAALKVRAQRTELLANNLANVDTPNFKARDVDFRAALQQAAGAADAGHMLRTNEQHIEEQGAAGFAEGDLLYRVPSQPSLDGNTVDVDLERSAFAENTVRYQASLHFVDRKLRSLISALKGE